MGTNLTALLHGKTVDTVTANGKAMRITMTDGTEVDLVWMNEEGRGLEGRPHILAHGRRIRAVGVNELFNLTRGKH